MAKDVYDVAVLGGGAAGMMAAIQAAKNGASVLVTEGNECLGKKILATGNGKCNLTNENMDPKFYYGAKHTFIKRVLDGFSLSQTLEFFRSIGIEPVKEDELYYPRCKQAAVVVAMLEEKLMSLGVTVVLNTRVRGIEKDENGIFHVKTTGDDIASNSVVLALGGKASAIKGSNGDGYYYGKQLGHEIVPTAPALVQLHTDHRGIKDMAGTRCHSELSLFVDDACVRKETGELQLTDYGISGIVVFQLSRMASVALTSGKHVSMQIDFLPEYDSCELMELLERRFEQLRPQMSVADALWGLLNHKVAIGVLKECSIAPDKGVGECGRDDIYHLCQTMKAFHIVITDTHGFKHAQVTAGGISTDHIDPNTMESKICPGLYIAGEILDVDGICGGYNLQWAWSSGALAGEYAAKEKK